jgi:multidrug efflux pump
MLARFFVDRPIFAWVISIVIILMGSVSYVVLPVAQYPEITPPTVQVTASYPGANAKVVVDSVAAPIEQQVNGVERMLYMSSQCTNDGAYTLTVTFDLGTDLNIAQVLVQNRVSLAMPQLPSQVQVQGVSTKKKSPSILLVINLTSPDGRYDDLYLSNYATTKIKDEILRIPGVGDMTYLGQRDYSMRVWLDPDKMAAVNLSTGDVVKAVQNQNIQVAAGQIGQQPVPAGQQFQFTMSTLGRLEEESQFAEIILKTGQSKKDGEKGSPVVRLRDVARIELGAQQYDQICRLDGLPTVGLAVFQLPGSNALEVASNIKKKMAELKNSFPPGVDYSIVYDTTPFILESMEGVIHTLLEAVLLVALVVLFFLQDWKAMILPMISVPVSLIGTIAVMALLGFTLNTLTLFGLVLAIGIVVDDAIMVLENIERLMATGLDARAATIKSMDEITGPIVAITLVLISVFLPAAFIPGISGQFFRQFALTIAAAMVISAVNAMTCTPAQAVTIFKTAEGHGQGHEHQREALPWWIFGIIGGFLAYKFLYVTVAGMLHVPITEAEKAVSQTSPLMGWAAKILAIAPGLVVGLLLGKIIIKPINKYLGIFFKGFNLLFDMATAVYGSTVGRLVRLSFIVMVIYGGFIFLTYLTMSRAPTGFIPLQDQGYLLVNIQLPDSASVQRTKEVVDKVNRMVLGDDPKKYKGPLPSKKEYAGIPGVAHAMSIAGQSSLMNANGSNFGSIYVILEPFEERLDHDRYDAVIADKIRKLCNEEIDEAQVTVFRAPPIQGLGNAGGFKLQVEQKGFVDLTELQTATDELIQAGNSNPKLVGLFSLYRAETPQVYVDIDRTKCQSLNVDMQDAFNTLQVYMGGAFVNLFNKFGRTWQVNVMAEPSYRTDAAFVRQLQVRNKEGKMVPMGTIAEVREIGGPVMVVRYNMYSSAAITGNTAAGVSSGQSIQIIDDNAKKLGVTYEWTEITYMQILAGNVTAIVFSLGSLLVYLVLAAKYESWRLPMSVIMVVPMCLLCAVIGMLIVHLPVDIFVQVGFLVLVGLAAKNAIMIVEFAEQLRMEGKPKNEAILESCRLRLRPIIMTSFAFILGVVPLVLGKGAGAEMRVSMGTAVFAGMIGVTFFGIFLTPVFYSVLTKVKKDGPS